MKKTQFESYNYLNISCISFNMKNKPKKIDFNKDYSIKRAKFGNVATYIRNYSSIL